MKAAHAQLMWQPPGWSPPGAVAFLHALLAGGPRLADWAAGAPDVRWGEWLVGQGLAPYVWRQLKAVGCTTALPQGLSQALRGAYYTAVADAELRNTELRQVLDCLKAAGVTPILFKGAALAYTAYPDPACRPMGDLDLWVTEDAMPLARAALQAAGYREQAKDNRPLALQQQMAGEIALGGTRPGHGLVELHWGTFAGEWLRRTAAVEDAEIRCRSRTIEVLGCEAWTLAAEDAVIQLAVHLAVNHQMGYPGVRGLLDVVLLARTAHIDWEAVVDRSRAWRVKTAVWLVLRLAEELLGLYEAAGAIAALAPAPRRRAAISRFVDGQHVLEGRDMTGGPQRLAFQLLLVDRMRDAVRLISRTLWPEDAWLRTRYGANGPAVRARHLASAVRGKV